MISRSSFGFFGGSVPIFRNSWRVELVRVFVAKLASQKGTKGLGKAGAAWRGTAQVSFFFLSTIFGMNNLMEQPPSLLLSPSSLLKSINNYDDFLICQSLYLDLSNIIIL